MSSDNNLKQEYHEMEKSSTSHVVDISATANDRTATTSVENIPEGKMEIVDASVSVPVSEKTSKKDKKDKKKKKNKKGGADNDAESETSDGDGKEKKLEDGPKIGYFQLYRFATTFDWICVLLGTICSLAQGVGQPLIALLMGDVINKLNATFTVEAQVAGIRDIVIKFTIVGAVMFFCAYGQMCFFTLSAENQTKRIRELYLHSVLRQDISWHDVGRKSESLNTRLSSDTQLIFDGLADKVGMVIMSLTMFVAGFVIAFVRGWRMALVLMSAVPLMAVCGALMAKYATETSSDGQDSYARAGALAEQAFSSIRTVVAFDGQKREMKKYQVLLDEAYGAGLKKAIATGLGMGSFMMILFLSYSLAFWYGSHQVRDGKMDAGAVLAVLFGTIIGAFSIGNVGPNIAVFAKARAAGHAIFEIIDRVPEIDAFDPKGLKPDNIKGHIVVKDVNFTYPSRPDVPILKNMNIEVKSGQTVALVGHSGSGKSTIIGLVERFYDPSSGSITLDGHELKDINVRHLRDTIGLVSQEPVLFNATIKQNILYGVRKDQSPPTDQEIENACKLSNAHDFISKLPQKYNTMVGEKGALLSGGQKQRIAIARALIKNPSILLLDEATSALDTESERIVQAALDNASTGRSTIVIAHRLSTIMNADLIYVMDKGIVMESGTHESLLALGGIYSQLVAKQQLKSGGVDIDNEVLPEPEPQVQTHIAIAEDAHPERDGDRRKSFGFASKMRRMSSTRSIPRSEKSLQRIETRVSVRETPEEIEKRKKKEQAEKIKNQKAPITRVLKSMRSEWNLLAFGAILSGISGAVFPMFAKFFGDMIKIFFTPTSSDFTDKANFNALMFLVIGIVSFISTGGSITIFEYIGETMARRMRTLSFQAIMSQEMGFFDKEENSTGALSSRLATDAYQMHELVSQIMKLFFQTVVTVALGLGFAFSVSWQLTLVILALIPLLAASQYFAMGVMEGFSTKTKKAYEQSGRVANEAITNIRTVVTLAKETRFEDRYKEVTLEPHHFAIRRAYIGSIGYALSQGIMFWTYAVGFYAGHRFSEAGIMSYDNIFPTMFYIIFMAMGLGQVAAQVPKFIKGKESSINGKATIDKYNVRDLQLNNIRKYMALVGQEPVLFDISIGENIRYGIPDGQSVDHEQVVAAARASNIHDFVMSLPQGYDTRVGDKGSQLSGGQKQRIAIARALIRNPKILLLDEATSALDSESEKLVQDALDRARAGRTTIVIAHRLRTIQDADLILVVKDGSIIESGRHYELLSLGGLYSELCKKQNLEVTH
ncbi:Multidrug resistance protein 1 [Lunasporangiospora selenospora]|uniref:Multidrug resistance protein 1 n=1 Tax=Lunasporangiospora selenospora TaxID=979761 RepID=A0A9P6KGV1_9FUNG|nr:Multidrug resistance protein 1 [Lunasporangiospora selenospora]